MISSMGSITRIAAVIFFAAVLEMQTQSHSQVIEDLVNIRFRTDVRVFAVMAALNVAGFDLDAGDLSDSPVRRLVREHLSAVSPDLRDRIRRYYTDHNEEPEDTNRQGKYISYALLLKEPPQFTLQAVPSDLPPEVRSLTGFGNLLEELWKQANLAALWDQVRPDYIREMESYRTPLRNMILETLNYMHTEPRIALDRQVTFISDLLNGYGVVNARNIGNDYVVLVGPGRPGRKPMHSIRHEYLHFMIDPLVAKYFGSLPEADPYLKKARAQPGVRESIGKDFVLLVTESLIQMLELRLDHESGDRLTTRILEAYEQGLVLAPYFEERLAAFETRRDPFQDYYPGMIRGIRWEVEAGRDTQIAQLRQRLHSNAKPEGAARDGQPAEGPEVRSLLYQANQLLADGDFDGAAPLLAKVLQIEPLNANAMFGAAQIAAQAQDFGKALELYDNAAAQAGAEVWIVGWSRVQRGKIYQFLGDADKARAEWSKVLKLQGNLHGAAEAAKKALDQASQ